MSFRHLVGIGEPLKLSDKSSCLINWPYDPNLGSDDVSGSLEIVVSEHKDVRHAYSHLMRLTVTSHILLACPDFGPFLQLNLRITISSNLAI